MPVFLCAHARLPYSGFTLFLCTNSSLLPLTDVLFCFRKSKCRQWFISFEVVPWYSSFPSFPSSKSVICFSSEHSSAVLFHPCLVVMRNGHQLRALFSLHMPGELLLWARTVLAALVLSSLLLASCFIKFFLIFPVQPSIKSRDWNLSVSACHLATSASEDGVLKCQRSALLHQHLLMG